MEKQEENLIGDVEEILENITMIDNSESVNKALGSFIVIHEEKPKPESFVSENKQQEESTTNKVEVSHEKGGSPQHEESLLEMDEGSNGEVKKPEFVKVETENFTLKMEESM